MSIPPPKAALRSRALDRRREVHPEAAQAFAARLAEGGMQLVERLGAHVVSAYWPLSTEASTVPLLEALARRGIATVLPVTISRQAPLRFRQWRPGDPLAKGQMAIPEPLESAPDLTPDLLFVPLAAFDRTGHRIGYGAGHYDRTLARLRAKGHVMAVGVAFAAQEVADVGPEAHDQPLDAVITERELIACNPGFPDASSFYR